MAVIGAFLYSLPAGLRVRGSRFSEKITLQLWYLNHDPVLFDRIMV
jgi:hypothetical protein